MSKKDKNLKKKHEVNFNGDIHINIGRESRQSRMPSGLPNDMLAALAGFVESAAPKDDKLYLSDIRSWAEHYLKEAKEKAKSDADTTKRVAWDMRADGMQRFLEAIERLEFDEKAIHTYLETEQKVEAKKEATAEKPVN